MDSKELVRTLRIAAESQHGVNIPLWMLLSYAADKIEELSNIRITIDGRTVINGICQCDDCSRSRMSVENRRRDHG